MGMTDFPPMSVSRGSDTDRTIMGTAQWTESFCQKIWGKDRKFELPALERHVIPTQTCFHIWRVLSLDTWTVTWVAQTGGKTESGFSNVSCLWIFLLSVKKQFHGHACRQLLPLLRSLEGDEDGKCKVFWTGTSNCTFSPPNTVTPV